MSPVFDIQPHLRELGRLRAGEQQEITTKGGKTKTVPARLETWRFTTPFRNLAEAAAKLHGGEVRQWEHAPTQSVQWEVITETSELEVLVPPQDVDTTYELWSGGGRKRLCDGITEQLSDGPCLCDPVERECKPRTQLVVVLPQIPDLGQWRLVTQSVFAAMELPATMMLLRGVHERAVFAHATLAIDQRTSKTDGTRHFAVPVLRLDYSLAEAGLVPTKLANPVTGEIIERSLPASTAIETGQPAVATEETVVIGEGATSLEATAGDTSEPSEASGANPPSGTGAEYEGSDDVAASGVQATSTGPAEEEPAPDAADICRHLNGSYMITNNRGDKAEICGECHQPIEAVRQ